MASPQETIFAAVEARGYVSPWTPGQFALRQILKLVEELHEAASHLSVTVGTTGAESAQWDNFLTDLEVMGHNAEQMFKDREWCGRLDVDIHDLGGYVEELADCQVVLSCMGAIASRKVVAATLFGGTGLVSGFDTVAAAVAKATADIDRGASK